MPGLADLVAGRLSVHCESDRARCRPAELVRQVLLTLEQVLDCENEDVVGLLHLLLVAGLGLDLDAERVLLLAAVRALDLADRCAHVRDQAHDAPHRNGAGVLHVDHAGLGVHTGELEAPDGSELGRVRVCHSNSQGAYFYPAVAGFIQNTPFKTKLQQDF
jgi:hypothetical protein